MSIREIFAFLVKPAKDEIVGQDVSGVRVPLNGDLFTHLSEVYRKSKLECEVEISLVPNGDGSQQVSAVRDLFVQFAETGQIEHATLFAKKLGSCSTRRSGLGLLFVIRCVEGEKITILLSRFPTDTAILVDDDEGHLSVKFLEKVFVKTYYTYKAALFSGLPTKGEFWSGKVLDKQISAGRDEASQYWVKGFLEAEFKLTGHHGTTRLARALADASAGASFDEKRELHHLAAIASNLEGQVTSFTKFFDRFGVSDKVSSRIKSKVKPSVLDEMFVFSRAAYNTVISYRTVETHEGAILTASSADFEKIFKYETISRGKDGEQVRLSTEGFLAADKLRRTK